jgi:hypothetical protein
MKKLINKLKKIRLTKRLFSQEFFISILFILLIFILIYIEYKFSISKEIIAISVTGTIAVAGYFITNFLENKRREKEEKIKLYKKLLSEFRIFTKQSENKSNLIEKFEETYCTSLLFISSDVYDKLIDYMEFYQEWVKDKSPKNKEILNKKFILLMQTIRDEVTIDRKIEFKNYFFTHN